MNRFIKLAKQILPGSDRPQGPSKVLEQSQEEFQKAASLVSRDQKPYYRLKEK